MRNARYITSSHESRFDLISQAAIKSEIMQMVETSGWVGLQNTGVVFHSNVNQEDSFECFQQKSFCLNSKFPFFLSSNNAYIAISPLITSFTVLLKLLNASLFGHYRLWNSPEN